MNSHRYSKQKGFDGGRSPDREEQVQDPATARIPQQHADTSDGSRAKADPLQLPSLDLLARNNSKNFTQQKQYFDEMEEMKKHRKKQNLNEIKNILYKQKLRERQLREESKKAQFCNPALNQNHADNLNPVYSHRAYGTNGLQATGFSTKRSSQQVYQSMNQPLNSQYFRNSSFLNKSSLDTSTLPKSPAGR